MDDPFAPKKSFDLGNYQVERIILSPQHWKTFPVSHGLKWEITKFHTTNTKTIPDNKNGVYSFIVKPEIADHPACAFLMYVGKAEAQSLRQRFKQYFRHKTDTSRRVNISKMLRLWDGHLWFCYAPIATKSKIASTEEALLNAFLPPVNHRYRGVVARQINYLFS